MKLVEVARFASLVEAQIAAGALRSAGFATEVWDGDLGSVDPLMQQALGGFRLVAPLGEQAEARAFLQQIETEAPQREAPMAGSRARAFGAVLLSLLVGFEAGFLFARRRHDGASTEKQGREGEQA